MLVDYSSQAETKTLATYLQHTSYLQSLILLRMRTGSRATKIRPSSCAMRKATREVTSIYTIVMSVLSRYGSDPVFHSHSIQNDYDIKWQVKLGTGISGPVRLCVHKETGKEYAIKILLDRPKARKEVTLHWRCSGSEHVVRVIDVYLNDVLIPGDAHPKKRLLMVMELMEGGELFEYIIRSKHFKESEANKIMLQIAKAVEHCHKLNVAHRDLKPENLLLLSKADEVDELCVKLADFGFAKVDNGDLTTPHFTPYYVAPQVLEAQHRQREIKTGQRSPGSPYFYDKSCDMWSLGVILYIMLCGYPPFYSEIPNQAISQRMKKRILKGDFDFPENEWKDVSDEAKDLVQKLLCVEPSQRISVSDLLRHKWLRSHSVPSTDLPSPGILLDREALEKAKAVHGEFLQDMRGSEESGFFLKPLGKSNNKLLNSRQGMASGKEDGVVGRECHARNSLSELRDICLMPPPLSSSGGAPEGVADTLLIEGVKRALTFNENHTALASALQRENWNGNEFTGLVNRKRLAESVGLLLQ